MQAAIRADQQSEILRIVMRSLTGSKARHVENSPGVFEQGIHARLIGRRCGSLKDWWVSSGENQVTPCCPPAPPPPVKRERAAEIPEEIANRWPAQTV
jgi:hypothetical protein